MKKLFAFLMAVTMLFALTACGGNETAPETTAVAADTVPETTATPTTEAPTEAPTTVPTEPATAFDAGWAGAEYEMPIPQPPFTKFTVSANAGMYMITATDSQEIGQLTKDDVVAYCDQLKTMFNFTNIQRDGEYENRYGEVKYGMGAATEDGMVVELDYGAGSSDSEPSFVIVVVLQ